MAEYRTLHTKIWQDEWFCELEPDAKLLFVYLVTNRAASLAGIYRLPTKFISFETGIDVTRVNTLLDDFQNSGKVYHEDGVIWVKKLRSYQTYNGKASEQVEKRISKDLADIPDSKLKREYLAFYASQDTPYIPDTYGPDTPTIPTPETETETETETILAGEPAQEQSPMAGKTATAGFFFETFKRKRWANTAQAELFGKIEHDVGPDILTAAIRWAAEKGTSDLHAIHSTAKKMLTGPKAQAQGTGAGSAKGRDGPLGRMGGPAGNGSSP